MSPPSHTPLSHPPAARPCQEACSIRCRHLPKAPRFAPPIRPAHSAPRRCSAPQHSAAQRTNLPLESLSASLASASSSKVTKQKPLDRPVSLSYITWQRSAVGCVWACELCELCVQRPVAGVQLLGHAGMRGGSSQAGPRKTAGGAGCSGSALRAAPALAEK